MAWYFVGVSLHVLAAMLWFGHMIYWAVFVEPTRKRLASEGIDCLVWPMGEKLYYQATRRMLKDSSSYVRRS